jgi:uncharacterized membrane protein YjgN (DUF898 family)
MQPYPPVVMATAAPVVATPVRREIAFRFTGSASEYFRIWIVNTLLTIATLGIYSAWAKVRNKQYFYRHTSLDGSTFEYLADPVAILKGRLIAAAALGLLFGSQHYSLTAYGILIVLFVIATPWIIVKSLAFNARNSSFRNIRFAFAGRPGEAFGAYFGMVVLYMATCGLGYPYAEWRMTSFVVHRHLYGDLPFSWHSKSKDYYKAYLIALAMTLPVYVVLVAIIAGSSASGDSGAKEPAAPEVLVPVMVVAYSLLLIPGAFLRARIANLVYGGTQIGEHRLVSSQRGVELLKIYALNFAGIVVSLGLLIPWAKVRLAAYRASTLKLDAAGDLFAQKLLDERSGALGEGLTDLGDFDLGIGT